MNTHHLSARLFIVLTLFTFMLVSGTHSYAAAGALSNAAAASSLHSRPVEQLLNTNGILDLNTGWSSTLNSLGWDVTLDAARGPLFQPAVGSPAIPAVGTWSALGTGTGGEVNVIAVSGNDVYAGGGFTSAGTCVSGCNYIAKWDGSTWSALGTGMAGTGLVYVTAIAISGSDVYIGGKFSSAGTCLSADGCNNIAKWDGSTWSALGTGTGDGVHAIAINGSDVYVGGGFWSAGGVADTAHVAKWDGSTWSALGTGTGIGTIYAIAFSGSDVYVGGAFTSAGSCTSVDGCNNIAKWNTSSNTWSALSTGTNEGVNAIAVSGSDLYVGGQFTGAGGVANTRFIAKWNGSAWTALGEGRNNIVNTIAVSDSDVYVGGYFAQYIARWHDGTWSSLGTGMNGSVFAITVGSNDVYAGGSFTNAGGVAAQYIARYHDAFGIYLPLVFRYNPTLIKLYP